MIRYVALLRGINTGGHRVKMDRLRELFKEIRFDDVQTFIASGNLIFSADEVDPGTLEDEIRDHLECALGFPVPTFLRTLPELAEVGGFESPDHTGERDSTYVVFLRKPAGEKVRENLAALESDMDSFRFEGREIFYLIHGKLSESPLFGTGIGKALGGAEHTMRNMNTVRRLLAKHTAG
jgi:uncharacterized protein (DUF1697 family)